MTPHAPPSFESRMKALYGQQGEDWLRALPQRLENLAQQHGITDLKPFENLTYHYVAEGMQGGRSVVLKLSCSNTLSQEIQALKAFQSYGVPRLLGSGDAWILMKKIVPGTSLRDVFPSQETQALDIVWQVIERLHQAPLPQDFPTVQGRYHKLNQDWEIPSPILSKARLKRDQLLRTQEKPVLLHGDLHYGNILKGPETGHAIDPKGLIGDPLFDVPPFLLNPIPEFLNQPHALNTLMNRLTFFADRLHTPRQRVYDSLYVHTVTGWIWNLEDTLDPAYFRDFVALLEKMHV